MSTELDQTLVDLLGDTRGQVVELLRGSPRTVAELAGDLEVSDVAVRRHLQALERDGFVSAETVRREGPGRPSSRYALTDRARRLFPDRSADLASDLLAYLEQVHGRKALLGFLRWRQGRQQERYTEQVDAAADTEGRVSQLAALLTADGFPSRVDTTEAPDGATVLQLRQEHCAIKEVAEDHPELCAYEAALFQQVLGARVSRRQTIAGGASACVCNIVPIDEAEDAARER